jgi:hypothetical protein
MTETEEKKKKGCWVFYKVPTGSPAEVEEDFHLTAPDGTVHRPDILGTGSYVASHKSHGAYPFATKTW